MRLWDKLQRTACELYAGVPWESVPVRQFANFEEKNAYDNERELQFALAFRKHNHVQS